MTGPAPFSIRIQEPHYPVTNEAGRQVGMVTGEALTLFSMAPAMLDRLIAIYRAATQAGDIDYLRLGMGPDAASLFSEPFLQKLRALIIAAGGKL